MSKGARQCSRRTGLRSGATLFVCLFPAAIFAQAISDIQILTPREFGYTIGDTIRHELEVSLADPYRLDLTNMPEPGRLNRWLEISAAEARVENRDESAVYRIVVDYQVFNAPRQLTAVTIPQLDFLAIGEENTIAVFLPEWTFTVGPLTSPDDNENMRLRIDRAPQAIPVSGRRARLAVSALLLSALLMYFAYRRYLLPRLERRRFPFSNALVELRRLRRMDSNADNYRLGLQAFHAAVNSTAGQVVFTGNLQEFLSDNARFAALKAELVEVYARSQDVFFCNAAIAESDVPLLELIDLCRRCRALERAAA